VRQSRRRYTRESLALMDRGYLLVGLLAAVLLVIALLQDSGPIHFCLLGACP